MKLLSMAIDGDPQSSTSLASSAELTVNRCYFKNPSNNRMDASGRGASGTEHNISFQWSR